MFKSYHPKGLLLGVLLIIWPFLNFMSHNKQELEDYWPVLLVMLSALIPLLAFQLLYPLIRSRVIFLKYNVILGFAIMCFFSFPVVTSIINFFPSLRHYSIFFWCASSALSLVLLFSILSRKDVSNFLLLAIVPIILFLIGDLTYYHLVTHNTDPKSQGIAELSKYKSKYPKAKLPNIYYFVLDGYTRDDYLNVMFNFDNTAFLNYLESRGFYIARKAYSNCATTKYSIPTTLNMDYYLEPGAKSLSNHSTSEPFFKSYIYPSISDTPAFRAMHSIGYSIVFGSHKGTPGDEKGLKYISGWTKGIKYEYMELLKLTPVPVICSLLDIKLQKMKYRVSQDPENILKQIKIIEQDNQSNIRFGPPFLFFIHILAPHPPFSFKSDCSKRDDYTFDFDIDNIRSVLLSKRAADAYIDQLLCINKKMKKVIDTLLETDHDAVIVVQADHGWPKGTHTEFLGANQQISFRHAILNAIRIKHPESNRLLYPSISPVNTFRVILNVLAENQPELLADKAYYVNRVTGDIVDRTSCLSPTRITIDDLKSKRPDH